MSNLVDESEDEVMEVEGDEETQRKIKKRRSATDTVDVHNKTGRWKHVEVWQHVIKEKNNRRQCKYCPQNFAGGASRIKAHLGLDGKRGNIASCPNYPPPSNQQAVNQCDPNHVVPSSPGPAQSLRNLEVEVEEYIQEVRKSWSNYGLTLKIHFTKKRYDEFAQECDIEGYTIYCPKGVIFLDIKKVDNEVRDAVDKAVIQILYDLQDGNDARHKLYLGASNMSVTACSNVSFCIHGVILRLLQIECEVCDWLSKLLTDAKRLYGKLNKKDEKHLEISRYGHPFYGLQTIIQHKEELESIFAYGSETTKKKFWKDREEALNAVNPLLQVLHLFDNFIPNVGYLYEAIEKVDRRLKHYDEANPGKVDLYNVLGQLKPKLIMPIYVTAAYLNPSYKYNELTIKDKINEEEVIECMQEFLLGSEEAARFDIEMAKYSQNDPSVFTDEAISELKIYHPVRWWEKFGKDVPLLTWCAVRLLSQPTNCLSHLFHKPKFEVLNFGSLDVLRLNVTIMEEFKELEERGEIFKPIDLSSIDAQLN